MSDDEPDAKRSRIFRACAQCVSAKTRCEEVTSRGCRSCRKKRKDCSLLSLGLGETALDYSHASAPPSQHGLEDRLYRQESVIASLESRIALLESQLPSPAPRSAAPNELSPGSSSSFTKYPFANPLVAFIPADQFSHRVVNLSSSYNTSSFPDVVALGHLSRDSVDMAFQLCKHRVYQFIPLDYFASSATPTPPHPFVVLSILQHIPSLLTPAICGLLEESIVLIMAGVSSVDVVLGLLILALAPETSLSDRPRPSPFRLISLAYDICINLGLHQVISFDGTILNIVNAREIWPLVQQKYILLSCIRNGRVDSTFFGMKEYLQPVHHEATLIQLILENSALLERFETIPNLDDAEVAEFHRCYTDLKLQWTAYRATVTGAALANALCAEFSLNLRYSTYTHSIPSPLAKIRNGLQELMGNTPVLLRSIIELIVKSGTETDATPATGPTPPSGVTTRRTSLPAYITTSAATASISMRRAAQFVLAQFPTIRDFVDLDALEQTEAILLASGGEASRLVCAAVEHLGPVSALHRFTDVGAEPPVDQGLPVDLTPFFDFFNWDLSTFQPPPQGTFPPTS